MRPQRTVIVWVVTASMTAQGCSHLVTVDSKPQGASIFVNGRSIGKTPTTFQERSGFHKDYEIRAELEGYEPVTENHEQNKPLSSWVSICRRELQIR